MSIAQHQIEHDKLNLKKLIKKHAGGAGPEGPQGPPGVPGADGQQGPVGPNEVSTTTDTDLTGILKGKDGKIAQAIEGEDFLKEETDPVFTNHPAYNVKDDGEGTEFLSDDGTYKSISSSSIVEDTFKNIVVQTPTEPTMAFATDKNKFLVWSDDAWYITNFKLTEENGNPDMGYTESDDLGYGEDYITDKSLNNITIGGGQSEENAIRTSDGELQIYLSGWKTIVTGFRFRENEDGAMQLEHKPFGFNTWIIVHSGNSNELGLNGRPIVRQYQVDMGAYPTALVLNGGEF